MLQTYRSEQHLNPWSRTHHGTAINLIDLSALFEKSATPSPKGTFIDQRFIDYLYANLNHVSRIHWRQFERFVAEYLRRQGYFVELGPGTNDDGVDIRMWPTEPQPGQPPLVIVQCKRQQAKIEKVIVKALWADVEATSSRRGLVATTSVLAPGAASTIRARGYGIDVANYHAIRQWLETMRTPGTGVTVHDARTNL
jgi:restriction system protein